ncbi:hypothetical protein GTY23_25640 [Streptomyces sp. SID5998]|nr:hypothetical protein [Streptomyces sp. SID5998]
MPFRPLRDALARLRAARSGRAEADLWDVTQEVRPLDPYVWPLPSPYDARWRRWSKRCEAAGRYLACPRDEECWARPCRPRPHTWAADDPVRPYVLRP